VVRVVIQYDVNLLVKIHHFGIVHRSDYGPPPVSDVSEVHEIASREQQLT
jgi:hypothetical protein